MSELHDIAAFADLMGQRFRAAGSDYVAKFGGVKVYRPRVKPGG